MNLGSRRPATLGSVAGFFVAAGISAASAQEVVIAFAPSTNTDAGVWFEADVRTGGAASIEDLSGEGGDLENDQPLPIGAALLTTDLTNEAKAEVGVLDMYGQPQDILASLQLSYEYYKATNPGQNLFAAPSIKLSFFKENCDDLASVGDCFGTLVYEPTWNQPEFEGSSVEPPLDAWTPVAIDDTTGLFWWTGGFGQPNTAGGPPLRTLAQWAGVFSSDFADSELVQVSIGVGSSNQGQVGYFDSVRISHGGGYDAWYDFEPAVGPPTDKQECKRGGWRDFNNPSFENQGQCVRFVVMGQHPKPHKKLKKLILLLKLIKKLEHHG